jgi:DNA mismatch repair protein MutS
MMEQYLTVKANHQDAFLFFRLGDFYEMFFDDAIKAAEELEITLTGRDGGADERIPMCGVPYHSAHTYIEKLISKGYKVAICEQVEDPATAKGVVRREVVRVITPGTIIEENMLVEQENHFLVTIAQVGNAYALAAADLSTGECHVTEIRESLSFFLDEICSYEPKEIVIEERMLADAKFTELLRQRSKSFLTPFSADKSLSEEPLYQQFANFKEACDTPALKRAVAILHCYLEQTQKRSLEHFRRLRRYDAKQYMMLDEVARRNLELTQTLAEGKRKGSLLWLLDRTATAMGSRLLKKWLDKPLLNLGQIEQRQEVVQVFLDNLLVLEEVRDLLKRVYDLERLAGRVAYGSANARDLLALGKSLEVIPELKDLLDKLPSFRLKALAQQMDECEDLKDAILRAIVDEPPVSVKEGGIIREGYHPELDELRHIQKHGKSWIAELEQREREATGIKSLKIGYNRVFGYYIEVTKSNLHLVPESRYQRKQTLANAERFITAELKEKEQLILNASERSMDLEYQLFVELRNRVASEIARLQKLSELVAELDVLHAFATVSHQNRYVRPQIHNGDQLLIEQGSHPVIEAVSREEFVPNDVEMDNERRQILLITGPNMAGKSTYMRQVALIAIMGQIGCFVPAKKAVLPLIDRIFTRIGAADDLVGGRSTFMVEMAETCQALKEATPRSLILLDEVGRGTSTYDGMALAQAIVEYIHDHVKAKTLFSTHYHELTQLEEQLPRLVNVHAKCMEKDGKVIFLHRIVPGGADRSYGIHVAELAGLPRSVIERARKILTELEGKQEGTRSLAFEEPMDSSQQLTLFDFADPVSPQEKEVLAALRQFDLLNSTPLEAMQFIAELKKKLKEG